LELLHGIIYLTKIVVPKSLNEMKIISTEKSEDACLYNQSICVNISFLKTFVMLYENRIQSPI
jgi:hypothetical protein